MNEQDRLTAHQIAKVLREGTNDIDLVIDINSAFAKIDKQHRKFLNLYSAGYSVSGAAKKLGMRVNPQRLFNRLIKTILKEVKGNDAKNSVDGADVLRKDDALEAVGEGTRV